MIRILLLISCILPLAISSETRIALVDVTSLSDVTNGILMKNENYRKLVSAKSGLDTKVEEFKRKFGQNTNPFLDETVALNDAILIEHKKLIYGAVTVIVKGKYSIVIEEASSIFMKDDSVIIEDISNDVRNILLNPK